MKEQFKLKVFTENRAGLLNRISGVLSRRRINIEYMEVKETEEMGIHQYEIGICETAEATEKVVKQIEKQIDVIRAFAQKEKQR